MRKALNLGVLFLAFAAMAVRSPAALAPTSSEEWALSPFMQPQGVNFDVKQFPAYDPETGRVENHSLRISKRIQENGGRGFTLDDLYDPSYTQDCAKVSFYWGEVYRAYKSWVHTKYAGYPIRGFTDIRKASAATQGPMYFSHLGRRFKPGVADKREPLVYYGLEVKIDGDWVPIPLRRELHTKRIGPDCKFVTRDYYLVLRGARCGNVYPTVCNFDLIDILPVVSCTKETVIETVKETIKWRDRIVKQEVAKAPIFTLTLPNVIMTNQGGPGVIHAPNPTTQVIQMGALTFSVFTRDNIFVAVSASASASASASSSSSSTSGGNEDECEGPPPDLPGPSGGGDNTTPPTTPPNNPPVPGGVGSGNSDINPPSLPPGSVSVTPDPNRSVQSRSR